MEAKGREPSRRKTGLVLGSIAFALLAGIAFIPPKSSIPHSELLESGYLNRVEVIERGFFSGNDHTYAIAPPLRGYPTLVTRSSYHVGLSREEVIRELEDDFGPRSDEYPIGASVTSWKLANDSKVTVSGGEGSPVMINVMDCRRQNLAGIVSRIFRNGLRP